MSDSYGIPQSPSTGMVPSIPAKAASFDGMPEGRREFDQMLSRHGVWLVYIHSDDSFPCPSCYRAPGSGEGSGDCPTCLGTGAVATIERVRAVLCKNRRSFTRDGDLEIGQLADNRPRVYFPVEARPGLNDLIVEVAWNVKPELIGVCGEPTEIIHVYGLDVIEPLYFGGQASFIFAMADVQDHHKEPLIRALAARRR